MQPSPNNHVYILRIWREHDRGAWRALIQNVADQSRTGFGDLESLTDHLCQLIEHLGLEGAALNAEALGCTSDEVGEPATELQDDKTDREQRTT